MKKTALVFLGIYFVLSIGIYAQDKTADAEKAIKANDFPKALSIAQQLIDENNASEALKVLIQLREKDPEDKNLFILLGDAYGKMNVGELAITNYTEAERLDSLNVNLKFKTAEALYKQKRYTEAVNKYLKVIAIDPKNKNAYVKAASIFYAAKLYGDAAVMYEKYLAIDQSEEAYVNIVQAFLEIRNYEKAYEYAVQGQTKYPNNVTLNRDAGLSAFALKKYDEAGKYYALVPDSSLSVSELKNAGYSFQSTGADSIAIKYFEQVVKKDSTQSGLFMDMANTYFRNKKNDLAIKYYQAKVNVDSTYEPAYRYMGFAAYGNNNYELARESFLKATKLDDKNVDSRYWLIRTYLQMDSSRQAAEGYSKLIDMTEGKESEFKDKLFEANNFLGQRAFNGKNYSGAISYLGKANRLKPETRFLEMLGACYHQLQNYDEAIKWYRAALKANPRSEIAKKGLRMLSAD